MRILASCRPSSSHLRTFMLRRAVYYSSASIAVSIWSAFLRRGRKQEVKPLLLSSQWVVLTKPCGLDMYVPAELCWKTGTSGCVTMAQALLTQLEQQVYNTHTRSWSGLLTSWPCVDQLHYLPEGHFSFTEGYKGSTGKNQGLSAPSCVPSVGLNRCS